MKIKGIFARIFFDLSQNTTVILFFFMNFPEEKIEQSILPNGIRLLFRHRAGEVSHLALMVNAGMRDEKDDENGLAHFVEHMIFKGTKRRRAYHILSCLENVGGDLNAYTTKEETCIHASFLKEHMDKAMDLFSDVAFRSVFPQREMDKEKEVILDEINSYRDTPSEEIFDEFENVLYEGHQLGRNILGTKELVENYSRADIVRFIKNNYSTERLVIGAVADMSFPDFEKMTARYFCEWQCHNVDYHRIPFESRAPKKIICERNSHLSHIMIGGLAYDIRHQNKIPLILLNNILGGPGMNSRLNLNIREKYGFAYTIESQYNAYSDTGNFSIYLGVDPDSAERSIELVFKELDKMRNTALGTLQLSNAKKQLLGQVALGNESGMNELLSIVRAHFYGEGCETMSQIREKIERITASRLLDVANEIFDKDGMNMLIFKGA